ncbi:TPA: DUF4062 domain-containing protein [Pseudomonas aeruginosa]
MSTEIRYQFFISSTYVDLEQERKKVSDLILELNHIPAGMELFSADNEEQWDTIQKVILNSDYYILIIGNRYGSIEAASGMSYTEKEYHFALENKIPILAFLADKDYSVSLDRSPREDEVSYQKLSEFKDNVKSTRMIQFWTNKDDLTLKIMGSIVKAISKYERPGWIRGNSANSDMKDKLLQYMEENNKLKEELEKYRDQEDSGKLSFLIENATSDFFIKSNVRAPIIFDLTKVEVDLTHSVREFKEISISDFPEYSREFISEEEIENYNKNTVPEALNKIKNYEKQIKICRLLKVLSDFKVILVNNGSKRIDNISVNIIFPDLFYVGKYDEEKMKEPKEPEIEDIFFKVNERYNESQKNHLQKQWESLNSKAYWPDMDSLSHLIGNNVIKSIELDKVLSKDSFVIDNNNIEINVKTVRQDSSFTLEDNFIIYPLKNGQGEIIIKILCENFSKWEEIRVPVTTIVN